MYFRPMWAKFLADLRARRRFFLGVISKAYNDYTGRHRPAGRRRNARRFRRDVGVVPHSDPEGHRRFRKIVITATMGLMLFYAVSFVVRLIAGADSVSFLRRQRPRYRVQCVRRRLAAMNLALDFDFIERGSKQGLPKAWNGSPPSPWS